MKFRYLSRELGGGEERERVKQVVGLVIEALVRGYHLNNLTCGAIVLLYHVGVTNEASARARDKLKEDPLTINSPTTVLLINSKERFGFDGGSTSDVVVAVGPFGVKSNPMPAWR